MRARCGSGKCDRAAAEAASQVEDATRPAQVRANNRPVEAVIDTGSEVTIGIAALRDLLMRRYADRFTSGTITDATGKTMELRMARIDRLRLGPVLLESIPIAFADVPPFAAFGLADGPALLLGTDLNGDVPPRLAGLPRAQGAVSAAPLHQRRRRDQHPL